MTIGRVHPAFWRRLEAEIEGDVASDLFARGRYATDASAYQCFPAGVVCPKSEADLAIIVEMAREEGISLIARGGGTSTAGQALGEGIIVDFSRYLSRVVDIDAANLTCKVEPGITPAALAAALRKLGLAFPVVIASGQQATLGGMLANNSGGLRALRYGRMAENVKGVKALLADGQRVEFTEVSETSGTDLGSDRLLDLLQFGEFHQQAIDAAWPERSQGMPEREGYDLRSLLPRKLAQNLVRLAAGSEGTLAVFTGLELKLVHRPENRALGACRFPSLAAALRAVPRIAKLDPSSIELLDGSLLDAIAEKAAIDSQAARLTQGQPGALLLVEFDRQNAVENTRLLKALDDCMAEGSKRPFSVVEILGRNAQGGLWRLRRDALARVMSRKATAQPHAFLEDASVPLDVLAVFVADLEALFARNGMRAMIYGHVGVGCLNVWPSVTVDPERARAFAEDMTELARRYNGTLTSGYGIGLARGEALEKLRGTQAIELFANVKSLLDPEGLFNPGKILKTPRFDDIALFRVAAGAKAIACDGSAICRSVEPRFGCPSFRVTKDERDSPRGRANTARLALSGDLSEGALGSDAMIETMRLCVSCKACKVTCPNGVDVPALKVQALAAARARGYNARAETLYARLPDYAKTARKWRTFLNMRDAVPGLPRLSERISGLAMDRPWPRFARRPYRAPVNVKHGHFGHAAVFADTFNQAFEPENLRSAANVLTAAGYGVIAFADGQDGALCCGRTLYDAGFVDEAKAKAGRFARALATFADRKIPVIGLEPACVLMARDEFAKLGVSLPSSLLFSLFEEFTVAKANEGLFDLPLKTIESDLLLHVHCHERAFGLEKNASAALALVPGLAVKETPPSCCGFNGGVGLSADTFETSLAMADLDLFPAIRKAGQDTLIAATGFSCRKQILDGLGRTARHPASIINLALRGDAEIVT